MSTVSFDVGIVLTSEGGGTDPDSLTSVSNDLSYHLSLNAKTRELSGGNSSDGEPMKGFIYVPVLDYKECVNSTGFTIPQNVTRKEDFPRSDYDLIALAPWVSANCSFSYLDVAKADSAKGFLFYKPDTTDKVPPPDTDPKWGLSEAGDWESDVEYPVYAVPGLVGDTLMNQSAVYSGTLEDADHGSELVGKYGDNEFPRLLISISSDDHSGSLPNLWIFLIGVLGILLTFVVSSSIAMRLIQRRRRQALARRLAAGEVDLESIGIKKLKVPRSMLDKMPLYIYTENTTTPIGEKSPETGVECVGNESKSVSTERHKSQYGSLETSAKGFATQRSETSSPEGEPSFPQKQRASLPENHLMFSQSTCPICLSDYVPLTTNVRELPCGHIFHPECIDTFLLKTSSLCPMCKKCTLPPGFCPEEVTNAMVYRERMARERQRNSRPRPLPMPIPTRGEVQRTRHGYIRPIRSSASRRAVEGSSPDRDHQSLFGRFRSWGRSPTEPITSQQADTHTPPGDPPSPPVPEDHDDDPTHEERMRRRAAAMLGPDHATEDHDREEESISRCKLPLEHSIPKIDFLS
ncbi:hypothetical protein FQN54_005585 [Arachnomyces sp. PD_36]|nr:hypothetical protein FQN54_005585 [Arachnomyces sp. PD_36]